MRFIIAPKVHLLSLAVRESYAAPETVVRERPKMSGSCDFVMRRLGGVHSLSEAQVRRQWVPPTPLGVPRVSGRGPPRVRRAAAAHCADGHLCCQNPHRHGLRALREETLPSQSRHRLLRKPFGNQVFAPKVHLLLRAVREIVSRERQKCHGLVRL